MYRTGPCCRCGRTIPWEDEYCLACENQMAWEDDHPDEEYPEGEDDMLDAMAEDERDDNDYWRLRGERS